MERVEAERLADGWVEWGGELIWAVGFTACGAPYGLLASELDSAYLQAMGLEGPALEAAGSWIADSDQRPADGDGG